MPERPENIRIPTISISDSSALDTASFKKFSNFIQQAYSLVHRQLKQMTMRQLSYVYERKGTRPEMAPVILMGHYDVVPVEASVKYTFRAAGRLCDAAYDDHPNGSGSRCKR